PLAVARARDTAGGAAVDDNLRALLRQRIGGEPDELLARVALLLELERALADEVVLVELRQPRHPRRPQVRLRVGVLADDHVLLLEPEDPLRLESERGRALGDEAAPELPRRRARPGQLA